MTTAESAATVMMAIQETAFMSRDDPNFNSCCCHAVVRGYISQRRAGGTWRQCSKAPRPSKQTCFWHRHLED